MEIDRHWKKQPKDGASLSLNQGSQPRFLHKIFHNTGLLTRSWYPLCSSNMLKAGKAPRSFTVGTQRITVYRGTSGHLYALDAFCPHFGADLGNGRVVGESIQCYFHQWQFSGEDGALNNIPSQSKLPPCPKLTTYPVKEHLGFIWVYSAKTEISDEPKFPFSQLMGFPLTRVKLFVHHHALMMSAIDLHHFFSVHKLPIDFQFSTRKIANDYFHWIISGEVPATGILTRLFRFVAGKYFTYEVQFYGGTMVQISYGTESHWFGKSFLPRLPQVKILWASTPLKDGVSTTQLFILHSRFTGFFKKFKKITTIIYSLIVLTALKDDDVKAYPHMKFNPRIFIDKDRASVEFIKQVEQLEVSEWSFENSI